MPISFIFKDEKPELFSFPKFCILIATVLIVGRIHESFLLLYPFKLTAVTLFLLSIMIVCYGGISFYRLGFFMLSMTFKLFLVFLGICIIGIPFSIYISKSLMFFIYLFLTQSIYWLGSNLFVNKINDLSVFTTGAFYSLLGLNLLALFHGTYTAGRLSTIGSYDSNDYALVVIVLCVFLWPGKKYQNFFTRSLYFVILISSAYNVYLTQSRGALITGIVAFGWLIRKRRKSVLVFIIVLLMGYIFLPSLIGIEKLGRLGTLWDLDKDYNVTSEKSGRLSIWSKSLSIMGEYPVLGTGINTFTVAMGTSKEIWKTAHNTCLQIGVELGFSGLIVYLSIMLSLFKVSRPVNSNDWLAEGIRCASLTCFVGGMFLSWAYQPLFYFILIVSIIRERVVKT